MDNNSNTFTIMPMGRTLSLKAGEQATGTVEIINQADSKDPFTFKATVAPYGVKGEGYDADLVTTTEQTQLANWITIDSPTGTLAPGESTVVNFTVNVPKNAPAGGQYAAIVISSDSSSTEKDSPSIVDYVYEMASIIYGEVAGKTVHNGSIVSHSVPTFSTTPKVAATALLENNGNIHEYANIVLTITNFFSGEEIFSNEEAEVPTTEVIMPNTRRQFINNLDNLPSLGVVTVKESIRYLGETSTVDHHIFICPLWFLLLVAFTLVSLVSAIIFRIRHRRSHSKHKKAEPAAEE